MRKNELMFTKDTIYRLLDIKEDAGLIIDCTKKTMPIWETEKKISDMDHSDESGASHSDSIIEINNHFNEVSLNPKQKRIMHERFTMISDILPLVGDRKKRSEKIQEVSEKYGINKQTRLFITLFFLSGS